MDTELAIYLNHIPIDVITWTILKFHSAVIIYKNRKLTAIIWLTKQKQTSNTLNELLTNIGYKNKQL